MSSDAATSNASDSLTLTSSEAPSHLQGCVSWEYQPFPLLTDRVGLLHLIETFCVTWDKILRVEFYQSLAGVGKVCFCTSYSHHFFLSHPTMTAAAPANRKCRGFWFCPHHLVQPWILSPEFQLSMCLCCWEASRQFCLLPYPSQHGSTRWTSSNTWRIGKKGHLSLLLTLRK